MEEVLETTFVVLEEENLEQYKVTLKENFLTDDILKSLLHSGTLSSTLAEIIPPLGHRLQIQGGLGRKWPLENIAVTVNSSGDIELATHDTSEVPIQDIKTLLKQHDINTRTNHGSQIIGIADSRNPLQLSLRKKLVSITCLALMNKTSSTRPSTDQRRQLADCIVEQFFPYMTEDERLNLKDAFFTPSCTFQNSRGKRTSKRPSGFIQSYFVNFWQANKPIPKICNEKLEMAIEDDELSQEEFLSIQEWLKANRGPPAKIFENL
ncbi:hypothetical protein Fcan01_25333 [Folsomia candida]|uniref:Uncharacterized protein n=1 Tax=Folsomia candida TaxID=158441 RepID=A0A226D2M4_FOLCA|nr:hypothetical protein Fcan01_25333 [Folsomia candida]